MGAGDRDRGTVPLMKVALADPATTAVVACALAGNAASLRVLGKLGLEPVGEVTTPDTNQRAVKLRLTRLSV
jgi:RimJ/RimL family protein N-acetyltransferase